MGCLSCERRSTVYIYTGIAFICTLFAGLGHESYKKPKIVTNLNPIEISGNISRVYLHEGSGHSAIAGSTNRIQNITATDGS